MTKDPWRSSQLCLYMRTLQQAPADVLAKLLPSCTTCSHIHIVISCACQPSQRCSSRCNYCDKPPLSISFHPSTSANALARSRVLCFLGRWINPPGYSFCRIRPQEPPRNSCSLAYVRIMAIRLSPHGKNL